MQVRMFAISYTNVNCFLRAQNSRKVSSSACSSGRLLHGTLSHVVLRFYSLVTTYSRFEKEMDSNSETVFCNIGRKTYLRNPSYANYFVEGH